jgi:TRAP-type C4-dicarboxylate transport system permease small subunit
MGVIKKVVRWIIDFVEVHLPVGVFVALFLVFLINVFFRYVVKNPQNWSFEFSNNAFVFVGLLGACAAYRKEDHVVFDLLYARLDSKGQNVLRIISYIIVIVFFSIAIPGSIEYLVKLPAVTPIMKIPLWIVFSSFPILMISTIFRSVYRLVLDIKAFRNKTYDQTYNTEEKDAMI